MVERRELTDGQRSYLRGLSFYPWVIWSQRGFLGMMAFMAVVGPLTVSVILPGFLLTFLLGIVSSVAKGLAFRHLRETMGANGFIDRARLGSAMNYVIYRDVLLGRRA